MSVLFSWTPELLVDDFNTECSMADVNRINPSIPLMKVSSTRNTGLEDWYQWLSKNRQRRTIVRLCIHTRWIDNVRICFSESTWCAVIYEIFHRAA